MRFVIHGGGPLELEDVGLSTSEPSRALDPGDYIQDGTVDRLRTSGHPFLADLADEAKAVIEYLTTL